MALENMDYLIKHAIDNVWCTPRQDRQYITRPKRISRNGGEVVQIELDWLKVYLPDSVNYYHVYQIGGMHPDFLGLFPVKNEWVSMSKVSNQMGMIADAYTAKGVLLPKFETFYYVSKSNNLVIATRRRDRQLGIDYNVEDVFFRVYTNAFYQSDRSNLLTERTLTNGRLISQNIDILNLQQELINQRAKPVGYAWGIINGMYVEEISPFNCKIGDLVDWVYDSSVQKVVEFEIDYLPNFDSTLDSERKYLLHYPGKINNIEYQDDVDIFLVDRTGQRPNGLFHHKNDPAALRMVTHKDYSMSVQLVNAFVDGHPKWTDPQKLRVLLLIRESGWKRPLVFENSRIHELYKLKEEDFLPALIGDNATVPVWRAEALEAAAYTAVMRQDDFSTISRQMVQDAYGYNACSKLLGSAIGAPVMVNGQRVFPLAKGLREKATAYEYNSLGLLLGWFPHANGDAYVVQRPDCTMVEMIVGSVGSAIGETYAAKVVNLNPKANYRMYVVSALNGIPKGKWEDVTGTNQYAIVDNVLTWLIDTTEKLTMVRSDEYRLGYAFNLPSADGLMVFDLIKYQYKGGQLASAIMDIPMGELDLFMNGFSLIENVDYVVHFPKIVIFNKKFLVNPQTQAQQIAVRFGGFCKKDLTRDQDSDTGFIKIKLNSRNGRYDLRDDRVIRYVINGRFYLPASLRFSENDPPVREPQPENGWPYSFRDLMVPMRGLTNGDTYDNRAASRVIDKAVSDYLTVKLPEPAPPGPNVIQEMYPVFSPFFYKVMYSVLTGVLPLPDKAQQYDDADIRRLCSAYEWILAFDPTQSANELDPDYVIVHPLYHDTTVDVDIYQYTFLRRVVNIYMQGKLELSHFLKLK